MTGRPSDHRRISAVAFPVAAAGALLRAWALYGSDDPDLRDLAVAMVGIQSAIAGIDPRVVSALHRLTGEENTAAWISQLATATAAGYGSAVLHPSVFSREVAAPRVRRRRRHLRVTLAAMTALFLADRSAPAELRAPSPRLFTPRSAAYWLVFTSYMSFTTSEVARHALRSVEDDAVDPSTRWSMRLLACGAGGMAIQYAQFASGLVGRLLGVPRVAPMRGTRALAGVTAAGVTIVVGACAPGTVLRGRRLTRQAKDLAVSGHLGGLWCRLEDEIGLSGVPISGVRLGSADLRLQRRVIEILDALARLSVRLDPHGHLPRAAEALAASGAIAVEDTVPLARSMLLVLSETGACAADADQVAGAGSSLVTVAPALSDFRLEATRLRRSSVLLKEQWPQLAPDYVCACVRASIQEAGK